MQQTLHKNLPGTLVGLLMVFSITVLAQPAEYKTTREEYIMRFKDDAISEMLMHGVPASITLAQGMLESDNGNSALATYANNHFGIKCHKGWEGLTYMADDDQKNECFRKYASVLDSYSDHSNFLKFRPRYAFLFELKNTDYKSWAQGLKDAGYATDPKYPERLIKIIEANNLYQYDNQQALAKITPVIATKYAKITSPALNKIMLFNNIKYLIVKKGDTFFKIASDYDIEPRQLRKYNDLSKEDKLMPGQKLYLQPKRKRGVEEFHMVQKGETMYSISQLQGVKLKQLYKKNLLKPGEEPKVGDKLWLRAKKPLT